MSFKEFIFGKKIPSGTAKIAKERLQIILSHERDGSNHTNEDCLPRLQQELLDVVAKYVNIDRSSINIKTEHRDNFELLEINVHLADKE